MSKAKAPRVFVPLVKVDEEQRLVYGRITQEILDKSGEVMDYESSKPFFEKWSKDIEEASGGLSKGNVRVMHGLSVAGKLTELSFDDEEQAVDVCAKIVDDGEWLKVTEGCYTGFSVGGKYAKRWTETANDNSKIKKFTADPNEVSLVDNPCVPSATFAMVKADGAEQQVAFKVENDDDNWPDFAKADVTDEETGAVVTETIKSEETPSVVEKAAATVDPQAPSNDAVVAKAEELAKAANNGTTWMDHVTAARDLLVKEAGGKTDEGKTDDKKKKDKGEADESDDTSSPDDETDDDAKKVTPAGVKQVWTASDGKAFEKKEDAVAHEATLAKKEPETEAEKLRARLEKATKPEEPVVVVGLFEDFDRLEKVFNVLSTPWDAEANAPKLEKGMYSINRFSNVLSDMASLSRAIKVEASSEGGDEEDKAVSDALIASVKSLGASFLDYAKNQIEELLAGQDDDVLVSTYDYYYAAAKEDGENQLAKDVCSVIDEGRESSRERREELAKAFGIETSEASVDSDELPPPLQKRFDELTASNEEFKKIAVEAVGQVEELSKRMKAIEDTPLPRAPNPANVAYRGGDGTFFGKAANTEEEKMAVLHDMLKTMGPDAMATELIKLSHQHPQPLMVRGQ